MTDLPRRKQSQVLRSYLPLGGGRILDVGCGDGGLVRFLTREGAEVTGLECTEAQVRRAEAAPKVGAERYVFGRGEDLPFEDGSFDAVVYANSLHHVPVAVQGQALSEAERVLVPGGLLYVVEPLAEGPLFELMLPVEDETEVRAAALAALRSAAGSERFPGCEEELYVAAAKYHDFTAFKAQALAVDASRKADFEAAEAALRRHFDEVAVIDDGGAHIDQPFRLSLLRKRGD